MIPVTCVECDWASEFSLPSDLPRFCPECHASIERDSNPTEDDGSWKSHLA